IYLWANISLYAPITLRPLPQDFEPVLLEMPVIRSDEEEEEEINESNAVFDGTEDVEQMDTNEDVVYKSPEQLTNDLITLSSLPDSKWKNLLCLDLIKKRNKPKEPVHKPENAPFFLPTVAGLEPKFAIEDKDDDKNKDKQIDSHIVDKLKPISMFGKLIITCHENESNYEPLLDLLKTMGPSAIDAEIRSLSTQLNGSPNLLIYFLDAMEATLKTNKDFELIQSYLGLFLKIHTEDIVTNEALKTRCEQLSQMTDELWDRLSKEFNKSLCLTNYLRSAVL
ncbi:unnamed protein product, partial [Oppiella nova]